MGPSEGRPGESAPRGLVYTLSDAVIIALIPNIRDVGYAQQKKNPCGDLCSTQDFPLKPFN